MKNLIYLSILIFSFQSCTEQQVVDQKAEEATETNAEPTFNLTTVKAEIVVANKEFVTLFAARDSVGLANLYTQDAKFMMNGAPAISGISNIQTVLSGIMNSGISSVELKTIEIWGTENLIAEEGELSLFVGDNEVEQGKYIVLWKKEDGKWNLFRDIFNSNNPAE
ncbi:MAG: ketosteroid isomerase-like protein [Roseivirga sp.]|jgi:ketosteroid isomerase-like protein